MFLNMYVHRMELAVSVSRACFRAILMLKIHHIARWHWSFPTTIPMSPPLVWDSEWYEWAFCTPHNPCDIFQIRWSFLISVVIWGSYVLDLWSHFESVVVIQTFGITLCDPSIAPIENKAYLSCLFSCQIFVSVETWFHILDSESWSVTEDLWWTYHCVFCSYATYFLHTHYIVVLLAPE